jgi:hypothetical protein
MADAARFPRLAPPFAIVGASAGWLSAGLLANPLVAQLDRRAQPIVALTAAGCAAIAGALLRYWCGGRRYGYELVVPDPDARLATDVWWRHLFVMLSAGVITGAFIGSLFRMDEAVRGAAGGALCTLVFLPVGFSVLAAARRAQRARLGSIVAGADRRAVWSVLAATLGATTVEALPDWAAQRTPAFASVLLAIAFTIVACITVVDLRAEHALREAVRDLEDRPALSADVPRIDLGLGEDVAARLERSRSPYRGSDRALGLVLGSPDRAQAALSRAVVRGAVSLVVLVVVVILHVVANGGWLFRSTERQFDLTHGRVIPDCILVR